MVRRHHQHESIRLARGRAAKAATQAAGAVLRPIGSSDRSAVGDPAMAGLLGQDEAVLVVGDDEGRREPLASPTRRAFLQQGVLEVSGRSCFG